MTYSDGVVYTQNVQVLLSNLKKYPDEYPGIVASSNAEASAYVRRMIAGIGTPGLSVDAGSISIPGELAEGVTWGGLAIVDVAYPVADIETLIDTAIEEGTKPAVKTVEVVLAEGTEIDTETGEVVGPVVITPAIPAQAVDALALPSDLSLVSFFPFSIPWDVYNVISALSAEPVTPVFTVDMPIPLLQEEPFHISIDLSPFDDFAPVFRALVGISICIAILVGLGKWVFGI